MHLLTAIRAVVHSRLRAMAGNDAGYTTETVIWLAALAALALTIAALLGPKIIGAARDITFQ